ncbi:FAD-dependent oxidoreductase [Deinococcus sp. KSM4-11]|uniref:FAD-dependent oxidoreductase n=1 Tax=Deinococcus sp. KSM4-11 TaxID=2568654 RepID=UPI001454CA25|nr:FAD-dependent oxidoreductase [Deinococcus sp. KSM4-11]
MPPADSQPPGQVWAHTGQPFTPRDYGVLVLGAGRMGTACALFLRQLAPPLGVLLVEEGGLPNEEGATLLSPGIWTALDAPAERRAEAQWVRTQLGTAFGDISLQTRALIDLHTMPGIGRVPTRDLGLDAALVTMDSLPWASVHAQAATYRPGALALNAAQAAIRAGANLMLNTRAQLCGDGTVMLERLTVTNTHRIVVHETHRIRAQTIVVALGANGPHAVEHDLGVHTAHARAYRQFPRLNLPSTDRSPLLRAHGLTLRPVSGGYTLVPAIHHRDPAGYEPVGGKLTGVPTGLRRETLEDLVAAMDDLPALATDALETGRSLSDVPGAWFALPDGRPDGLPMHSEVTPNTHLLLGGPKADALGLSVAYDLAARIAGVEERPWDGSATLP